MKLNYFKTLFVAILVIFATTTNAETYSGTCGNNVNWSLDTETGLLKITGTGAMNNYYWSSSPWYSYKSNIKSVEISEGVTSISNSAFYNCSGLTSITIPNSVTSIGVRAFEDCSGLTSITIPNSVTSIGDYAFSGCSGLTGVYITDLKAWYNIDFGDIDANPLYYAKKLYLNGTLVRKIEIPEGVMAIKNYVFAGLSTIRSVTIPNSVTSIGACAFSGCSGLTSITIPNSVTSIGSSAFEYCSGLTSITIPESVTSIGGGAFSHCSGLTSITIPESVTSIGNTAFYYCLGLTSITIPNSVTSIGNYAFYNCSGLTSITIPNSVTSIGDYAFYNCSGLTSITIPNSVTSIGDNAFYNCSGLTGVYITDLAAWCNIEFLIDDFFYIGWNPLVYAEKLYLNNELVTNLVIPKNITSIKDWAFMGYLGLTSITIPNSVTSIGNSAFYYCSELTSVTIGSGVSEIGEHAFNGCGKLKSIYSLAEYPPFIYSNTFNNVDKSIPVYIPKGTKEDYEFEWSDFSNFIESDFTGIEDSNISPSEIKVITGNGIDICNYYGKLQVINLAGQVIKDTYVNGSAQITLPKGVYIIVTDNSYQKIVL